VFETAFVFWLVIGSGWCVPFTVMPDSLELYK
jgi:hypothetical protein